MSRERLQRELFEKNAKTFSFAAKFLGKQRLSKIIVLYEFCRVVDDIADNSNDITQAKSKLIDYKRDIRKGASKDPYLQGFITFLREEQVDKRYAIDLLDGVISDCKGAIRIDSEDALIRYCYHVAGSVGGLMCPLLGVPRDEIGHATPAAINLGIAMQLTNIARDVKEDAQNNRVYIPQDWIKIKNPDSLMINPQGVETDARGACLKLLILAGDYYKEARLGYSYLPLSSRFTIMIAANLYRAIGTKIRKKGLKYWEGRVFTQKTEKIWCCILSLTEMLKPSFWLKSESHKNDRIKLYAKKSL